MHTSLLAREEQQPSITAANSPLGVDFDHIDPYTYLVIHTLFPSHTCGLAFYTGLLRNAIVKQCTLPGNPTEVRSDAAVVSIKGYAELSLRLRLAYDTTHMYLVIFRALGLLYIEKRGKQTELIIPLGAYRPPAGLGEILRQLQERYSNRRPRVRRLISNIIERIMLFRQREQEVCEQPSYQDDLLTRVHRGLSAQGVTDPNGQIALSVLAEISPLITTRTETSTLQVEQRVRMYLPKYYELTSRETITSHQGSLSTEGEEQVEEAPHDLNLPRALSIANGSRTTPRATAKSGECARFCMPDLSIMCPGGKGEPAVSKTMTYATTQGRFGEPNLPNRPQTGEAAGVAFSGQGRFDQPNLPANYQAGDASKAASEPTSKNLPLKVDSEILLLNGNGEKNINIISLSVDTDPVPPVKAGGKRQRSPMSRQSTRTTLINQARSLAKLIEGTEENVGAYITLIRQHHPRTLRAAVIATLLRKHWPQGRGVLRKPGGYYTRRVQQFQQAIPEPILSLLQTYEQLSYEEIDAALGAQAQMQAAGQEPDRPLRQRTIRPKRGIPMSKPTAEMLARRIPLEDSSVQVRGLYEEGGIYAVRAYIAPVEHLFASIEDWECYQAQMQLLEQEESA